MPKLSAGVFAELAVDVTEDALGAGLHAVDLLDQLAVFDILGGVVFGICQAALDVIDGFAESFGLNDGCLTHGLFLYSGMVIHSAEAEHENGFLIGVRVQVPTIVNVIMLLFSGVNQ